MTSTVIAEAVNGLGDTTEGIDALREIDLDEEKNR